MVNTQVKSDSIISKETLPVLLARALVQFKVRDILTKYGMPPEESLLVNFSIEGQEPVSVELPAGSRSLVLEPICKTFKAAVFEDFIAPADVSFSLFDNFLTVYNLPKPSPEKGITFEIRFKNQDTEIVFIGRCLPCELPFWCV